MSNLPNDSDSLQKSAANQPPSSGELGTRRGLERGDVLPSARGTEADNVPKILWNGNITEHEISDVVAYLTQQGRI